MGELVTLRKKYLNTTYINKTCYKCGKTYPRTKEYFYPIKHSNKSVKSYTALCITCDNIRVKLYKERNKEHTRIANVKYRETERGYFKELWQSVKRSRHGCEFKSYEEFLNVWIEQQKTYGNKCPYLNIEMTRIKGFNQQNRVSGGGKKVQTNISKDRIDSSLPYSRRNLMFCSWKANDMKGSVTPKIAKRFLGFHKERFGDEY